MRSSRSVAIATAVVLCVSTMFPVVAALLLLIFFIFGDQAGGA